MKRFVTLLLIGSALSGCATTYNVSPLADNTESVRYVRGAATTYFDAPDMAIQASPLGFNSQRQVTFGLAVVNKTAVPWNFGYENVRLATEDGRVIPIYDRATLERQARNRALIAASMVAVAGGLSAYAAARNSYTTQTGTVSGPNGTYAFSSRTYDPTLASAQIGAAGAITGLGIASIQGRLNETLASLNGQILQTTTVEPSQSYGGIVVGDRLNGPFPERLVLTVSQGGVQHAFHFVVNKAG